MPVIRTECSLKTCLEPCEYVHPGPAVGKAGSNATQGLKEAGRNPEVHWALGSLLINSCALREFHSKGESVS